MNPRRKSREIKALKFSGLFRPPLCSAFPGQEPREAKGRARDLMKKTLCFDGDNISDLLVPSSPMKENGPLITSKKYIYIIKKRRDVETPERERQKRGGMGGDEGGEPRQTIRH